MSALHFWGWHNCGYCIGQLQLVSIFSSYSDHTTTSDVASLYLVPGAPAPLTRICVGGSNLLLLYADDRARLWDVKTLEFWRSMDTEKAEELLAQGGWTELFVALWLVLVLTKFYSLSRCLWGSHTMGKASAPHTVHTLSLPDSDTHHI